MQPEVFICHFSRMATNRQIKPVDDGQDMCCVIHKGLTGITAKIKSLLILTTTLAIHYTKYFNLFGTWNLTNCQQSVCMEHKRGTTVVLRLEYNVSLKQGVLI